jgi:hypothetical protein
MSRKAPDRIAFCITKIKRFRLLLPEKLHDVEFRQFASLWALEMGKVGSEGWSRLSGLMGLLGFGLTPDPRSWQNRGNRWWLRSSGEWITIGCEGVQSLCVGAMEEGWEFIPFVLYFRIYLEWIKNDAASASAHSQRARATQVTSTLCESFLLRFDKEGHTYD